MPKENVFHPRRILSAKLNDIEAKIPIIVAANAEELSQPENHFKMNKTEKELSRLQLFIKKSKLFGYHGKQATTKITELASKNITLFGKRQPISPVSIMQNAKHFSDLKEKSNEYLEKVLKIPVKEKKTETYLQKMVNQIYQIIKNACPRKNEMIHLVTMERDLSLPDANKNRLTAEFSHLLLIELNKKMTENNDPWIIKLDRVLGLKQRTSRAESYGIHRIAQQPLMLYQSRRAGEEITPHEKVIMIDDHIQVGASIACAAAEVENKKAHLLSIVCITAHKNNLFFNIQPEVKAFIASLLPHGSEDIPTLNTILQKIGLNIETLTNIEGMILSAILSDSKNHEHKLTFESLLKKYDASDEINYSLFQHQENSLIEEFEKPKIDFAYFQNALIAAVEKGRYTLPFEKQIVLSDEEGQKISHEATMRKNLPWLLFDFDDTLHDLNQNTFIIFQHIIKTFSGIEIPVEKMIQTRQLMKESGQYKYQDMLLSFIQQNNPKTQVSFDDITKAYQAHKHREPFTPKMNKKDFLSLRNKYRIGIITDGSLFHYKIQKMKEFYGVDIDGYINADNNMSIKPNAAMYHEFCKKYDINIKPIAYVGDRKDLDGGMASNVNLKFILVDSAQSTIDMKKFTEELSAIEEQRYATRKRWQVLKNATWLTEPRPPGHRFKFD